MGLGPVRISPNAFEVLARYPWPGNLLELENVRSRAVLKASSETLNGNQLVLEPTHLRSDLATTKFHSLPSLRQKGPAFSEGFSLRNEIKDYQRNSIKRTLIMNEGNWAVAARDLEMHRSNLHNLSIRLGLRKTRK